MEKSRKKLNKALKYAFIVIVIIGLLLVFLNLRKFAEHFLTINKINLVFSLLCALLVYGLEGIFLFIALRVFDEKLPLLYTLKYSLIINAVGYFISLGGITPFVTQVYTLDHHDIGTRKALLARVIQFIFFNIFFTMFLIAGYISILMNNKKYEFNLTVITLFVCFFFLLLAGFYLAIFWESYRRKALKVVFCLVTAVVRIFKRNIALSPSKAIKLLDDFNEGMKVLVKKPPYLLIITGITIIDWIFWLAVMYYSFLAVNYSINIGFMITGFSIGQIVGILSMVPGGLGTLEGSMALIYAILGIPLETALSAILLYRVSFNIIPFVLSMPFYFSLKHRAGHGHN